MKKATLTILAILLIVAQGLWAQTSVTTADALYNAVLTSQTVTLGQDITLRTDGRLHIDGTTVTLDLNGHTLTRPMTAADAGGQVIAVMKGGKLTITDSSGSNSGKITGGWSYQGGAIYVYEGCELTIEGGTITGNRADQIAEGGYGFGGGVENHGTMTMTGGKITGNTAGGYGGGIYNAQEATLTLTGGTVSGNSAATGGSGIYHEGFGGKLNMQGSPVVKDNTADDVRLAPGQIITVTGAFATGASIGVAASVPGIFTTGYGTYNPDAAPSTYFFLSPQTTGFVVALREGEASIVRAYKYIERAWDDTEKKVTEEEKSCTNYTPINGTDTSDETGWLGLGDGWYVVTGNSTYKALSVLGTDVHLIIPDGVTLYVNHVKLESGHKLSIYSQGANTGTLNAINDEFSHAAGIGGGEEACAGTIIIHGGIVNAKGNGNAAGIGGGYKGGFAKEAVKGGLTVYGGTITANADKAGAGIGSGSNYELFAGYVTIYGGSVTATGGKDSSASESADCGAGIGGGDKSPGAITHIYGGTIEAHGGEDTYGDSRGAGIGGGYESNGVMTHIHGGTVTATSSFGAAIGGGSRAQHVGAGDTAGGEIIIDGGTVNASTDYNGAAIGCGYKGKGGSVTINGGTVTATSSGKGAAIGSGQYGESATITINGGNVTATCTGLGAGIGCGQGGKSATITINGGNITASGDNVYGAGIGGGYDTNPKLSVTITGGTVTASGYNGIGSTRYEDLLQNLQDYDYDGTLTITGGKIYATGEAHAFGGTNLSSLMTLYDGAMVKAGNTANEADLFSADQRVSACVWRKYAAIEPCTHSGSTFTIGDGLTHHTSCQYCQVGAAGQAEGHVFGSDGKCVCGLYSLKDDADNGEVISALAADQNPHPVTLTGRTLWKDGAWNTLCLPFDVTTASGTLSGDNVQAMTLNTETSRLNGSTLTLNFTDATNTTIPAGTPFIIKWDESGDDITAPVFEGVTVSNAKHDAAVEGVLTFAGTYAPVRIADGGDNTKLYLGSDNTLYYPDAAMTIGAFRAYFQLADGITAGNPSPSGETEGGSIRSFVLNFGDEASGITEAKANSSFQEWFTLDGRRLSGKPSQKGLYLHNGRKVMVK